MRLSIFFTIVVLAITAAARAAAGGKGILELDSKPGGAEVYVDSKKTGTTPETEGQKLSIELAEGDHEIEIKKEGVGSAKEKITMRDGVTQRITITIAPEGVTNSLGMKFVPVPGTQVLMCIHETRNRDYTAYAAANSGVDTKWKNVVFDFKEKGKFTLKDDENQDHPVIYVSWDDAVAFCKWLGGKEGKTYRLPTDHEWSCAVGIGDKEKEQQSPVEKSSVVGGRLWGVGYPPPNNNVGNYWDSSAVKKGLDDGTAMSSYSDGYPFTAPAMKFPANKLGIYDLGGNVSEWCQDWFDPKAKESRVVRGGSWRNSHTTILLASYRWGTQPELRGPGKGFRCVLVVGGSSAP